MRILAVAVTLGLASCISPFRPKVLLDGVEAHQVLRDTWRIVVRGNDFTSSAPVAYYVLLQAAQTTIAHGGTHFIILDPAEGAPFSPMSAGLSYSLARPGDITIRIITVKHGKTAPRGALDADRVLQLVRARLLYG